MHAQTPLTLSHHGLARAIRLALPLRGFVWKERSQHRQERSCEVHIARRERHQVKRNAGPVAEHAVERGHLGVALAEVRQQQVLARAAPADLQRISLTR
jgi:hypothetical protein